eukprot:TRINITY_DN6910_c0_g1_i3.p1 TRINITY_DN6910_c0_g1~~TRINITY_DN6910_c0_g1_i3.p1  ORF type:complete len:240 (-),score=35.92 TRINITY_DN6910_c0_g1_i3:2-721(-)
MALEWHPDRNPKKRDEANTKFQEIGEAYAILCDSSKKSMYDLYGEEGLNGPTKTPHSPSSVDHASIFRNLYATKFGRDFPTFPTNFGTLDPVKYPLKVTLEELYLGSTRTLRWNRNISESGVKSTETIQEQVQVKPGWKAGTKLTYEGKGDVHDGFAQDIVVIIEELPHAKFERNENDLICSVQLKLVDALCGSLIQVITLDNRTLSINVDKVISPDDCTITVPYEGMPDQKTLSLIHI